ncbi:hypothetical protein SODALDRAFT_334239 [Sodiomyces alkalinus F11]|uniref:G-protein coupled receptors family 2 profile 2 domain-containing protein n=1 Tax=Sodiomyces alkalinus (strain CBS 110278 / VKM F-3762 / F11) TaxID=1314773 RepID=A0A3N2PRW0_SODAK|nr:hypothetical protein SODALDRAFT_334239 [Sodiomyces alkalinus F11]ROT37164.1 hypothetical protein SODALDRAFT_334239 [Sodiomyces alkalinus F11]
MALTKHQINVLIALERTGASLSLIGITFIFLAYGLSKKVRTIPNLFILFASIANIGASIACLIGHDGILKGEESVLCQAQSFLLEMFMQSDPWWSLAMAVNVFLVFFCGANPSIFKSFLWLYCIICFGGPFIPAIVLLVARPGGQPMYGDATLWCWIKQDWSALRIYTYYLPIWICIFLSGVIYFSVGYHVFHHRNQLRNLTFSLYGRDGKHMQRKDVDVSFSDETRDCGEKCSRHKTERSEDWHVTAVTEVQITTAIPCPTPAPPPPAPPPPPPPPPAPAPAPPRRSPTVPAPSVLHPAHCPNPPSWHSNDDMEETAIPPAAAGHSSRFETMISSHPAPEPSLPQRVRTAIGHFNARLRGLDPVKLAYLRTSFIFAISILITWTPSSINRINDLVNPDNVSYGLNVATAIVLPLQGIWNAVIFFMTSWGTVREEYREFVAGRLRFFSVHRHVDMCDLGGAGGGAGGAAAGAGAEVSHFDQCERSNGDETREVELRAHSRGSHENERPSGGFF